MNIVRSLFLSVLIAPGLLTAQQSSDLATIGNFDVSFEGAVYDGIATEFSYCVTGNDVEGFRALSNWMLEFDPTCVTENDIVSCGPEPCFYQEDDPNLVLTGIKFDDTSVEQQETRCYSFFLDGDWSQMLGESTVGLKAGNSTAVGAITGPGCPTCRGFIEAEPVPGGINLTVEVQHRKPPTVERALLFTVFDASGTEVFSFQSNPIQFDFGDTFARKMFISIPPHIPAGEYTVEMRISGMAGWFVRRSTFTHP